MEKDQQTFTLKFNNLNPSINPDDLKFLDESSDDAMIKLEKGAFYTPFFAKLATTGPHAVGDMGVSMVVVNGKEYPQEFVISNITPTPAPGGVTKFEANETLLCMELSLPEQSEKVKVTKPEVLNVKPIEPQSIKNPKKDEKLLIQEVIEEINENTANPNKIETQKVPISVGKEKGDKPSIAIDPKVDKALAEHKEFFRKKSKALGRPVVLLFVSGLDSSLTSSKYCINTFHSVLEADYGIPACFTNEYSIPDPDIKYSLLQGALHMVMMSYDSFFDGKTYFPKTGGRFEHDMLFFTVNTPEIRDDIMVIKNKVAKVGNELDLKHILVITAHTTDENAFPQRNPNMLNLRVINTQTDRLNPSPMIAISLLEILSFTCEKLSHGTGTDFVMAKIVRGDVLWK